jgi:multiple sugar transport system ATP-binding protein
MGHVNLTGVTKIYPNGAEAVKSISLEIPRGSVMVLVGPSGCGKTTTLRMVAGLESITDGTVEIGDRVVNDLSPRDRDIAMVFQNYALYPHMSVRENMGFSLRLRKVKRDVVTAKVDQAAAILGLTEYLDRRPAQLSGGQRQRVAMGRAIVREPQVFLMDEPLSNLDAKLRVRMRAEILRLLREVGVTTMYVTHDQIEAMTMGDLVAVMRDGVIEQLDKPQALYERPDTAFVAAFVGSPAMNLAEATVQIAEQRVVVSFGGIELALPDRLLADRPALRRYDGREILLGIRPEDLHEADGNHLDRQRFTAAVDLIESLGSDVLVHFGVNARAARIDEEHDDATLELERAEHRTTFVARLHGRSTANEASAVELAVDVSALHFFDIASGAAIRT